ncbi:MAG TPA: acyl-ACP--UDP-N-acetylglucosamine O-acyltransferase [Tepidisphaeraceae bacterium]|nr:acyl-ACP--UDP-N-acetylglucosamine O-acyltransferase [Tepidisphaeraceae bacterium]
MPSIHPTAIVDHRAELADDVQVGPFCIIEANVSIGAGTVLHSHSVIAGPLAVGAGCKIGPSAYVGLDPQHLEFLTRPDKPLTWAVIGNDVIIREGASIHRATRPGLENATRVGNRCMLMGSAHVAHDCKVADGVIMANAALLGGHTTVGEKAFIGGGCTIHQFCRIGRLAMVGGNQSVGHDVPPFAAVLYNGIKGYNAIGCKRAGMSRQTIHSIRAAWQLFHTLRTLPAVIDAMKGISPMSDEVREIIDFMSTTKRGIQPSVKFLNYLNMKGADLI